MDNKFGGAIWTNHALARLKARHIKQGDAWATFRRAQKSSYDKTTKSFHYQRLINNQNIEVVAKQNEKNEWLIISVWSDFVDVKKPESIFVKLVRLISKIFG